MSSLILAGLASLCVGWYQAPADPAALVRQLGSPRFAERQEAFTRLRTEGRGALPALRAGREADDPEIQARCAELVNAIEAELLVQPTTARLDFKDRPIDEVVSELSRRYGVAMSLVPEQNPAWKSRRITLDEPEPVPFWRMIDLLAERGQLKAHFGNGSFGRGLPMVQLMAGGVEEKLPTFDSGPFRSILAEANYHINLKFGIPRAVAVGNNAGGPANPPGGEIGRTISYSMDLRIHAEPRMSVSQSGPLELLEVVDDRGQSMIGATENAPQGIRSSGYFGMNQGMAAVNLQIPLAMPATPGKLIRRLRGRLPVTLSTRKDDPLVISLAEAVGKTFEADDAVITIHAAGPPPDNQPGQSLELSVGLKRMIEPALDAAGDQAPDFFAVRDVQSSQMQIELADAKGRVIQRWYPASTQSDNQALRMTIQIMPDDEVGPPTEVRYYSLVRTRAEVALDFRDLPVP